MKKILVTTSFLSLLSCTAYADTLAGIYISGQIWSNEVTGIMGESGDQIDFGLEDKEQGSFQIAVEHPVPFIPNAKLATSTLSTLGSTTLSEEIDFGGTTFTSGSNVTTDFDVSYLDYTLYYEIFDNDLLSVDVGITGRDFDGDVTVTGAINTASEGEEPVYSSISGKLSTSEIVPMLYASTSIGLPFTGVNLFAEGNFLSIDDHTLYDYQAGISYELIDNLVVDVNLTFGYKEVRLELEDIDDLYTELEFKGFFAGAVIHF